MKGEGGIMKILFPLIAGVVLLYGVPTFSQEQAPAPTYKAGDFWQYRVTNEGYATSRSNRTVGDYEVRFTGSEYKVYELRGNQKVEAGQAAKKRLSSLA
jgi:hypothetical protein